jgi:nucleotide-binding universal stress UspA family protein
MTGGRATPTLRASDPPTLQLRDSGVNCGGDAPIVEGVSHMTKILVGVDGSPASQSALEWSAQLATRGGFELVAARVFVSPQAELPPDEDALLHDEQRRELEHWCAAVPAGMTRPRPLLRDGDPLEELLVAARQLGANMLVVGAPSAGRHPHVHLGTVAHHLAHHSNIPLAIVPAGSVAHTDNVVVGVDGSPGSLVAAEFSAELAGSLAVPVTAVYALEPFVAEWVGVDASSWKQRAEADARSWSAPVARAGLHLDVDVDRDIHPVAAIARALESRPHSVAVLGTHGHTGFAELRLGHVPFQLLYDTATTIVVVPARDRNFRARAQTAASAGH